MPKIQLYLLFLLPVVFGFKGSHPFYLSVTDIVYKTQEQQLQVTVRVFANDFEKSLRKTTGKPIDLYNAVDPGKLDSTIKAYISACLIVNCNGRRLVPDYLGHEIEQESCYIYFQQSNCTLPQKLNISNKLLYDSFTEQSNIVQIEVAGNKKSGRVSYPNSTIDFEFNIGNQ